MYTASDLRKGLKIEIDGEPYQITFFDFCKPGKGQALYRCKLKSMVTGSTMVRTYRSADKIGKPDLEEKSMIFSYDDGSAFVFMDGDTYEEVRVEHTALAGQELFLDDNMECSILFYRDKAIEVTLPYFVEKEVVETEPGAKGDTATNVLKPAKTDNGLEVQVPLFVNQGDVVKIDTRTGAYVERVRKS